MGETERIKVTTLSLTEGEKLALKKLLRQIVGRPATGTFTLLASQGGVVSLKLAEAAREQLLLSDGGQIA